jgi:hypothetical protein
VEYPKASLVDNALFGVTEIVKFFGLEGRWVTSYASSDCTEFLATDRVRKVSGCVAFIGMTAKFVLLTVHFLDYLAGGNRLHEKVILLP